MTQRKQDKPPVDDLAGAGVVIFEDPGSVDDLLDGGGVALSVAAPPKPRGDVLDRLVEAGIVTQKAVRKARKTLKDNPRENLQSVLLRQGACSEEDYLKVVAEQYALPFRRLGKNDVNEQAFSTFTIEYIQKNHVIGILREPGRIMIGMSDPANVFLIEEIRRTTGLATEIVVVPSADILKIVEDMRSGGEDFALDDIIPAIEEDSV